MQARANLLIPVIKGWMTERSLQLTSDAVQVHGGMGFIEETGAAQHFRDARILPIYEGTTAIQANDLVFRKTLRDNGAAVRDLIAEIRSDMKDISMVVTACRRRELVNGAAMCGRCARHGTGARKRAA